MIAKNIDDIKKHIGVNQGFDFTEIEPYGNRAANKFLIPLIGQDQYQTLNEYTDSDAGILKAKDLASAAECNFGYYLYLPIAAVQITSAGILQAESENTRAASDKNLKELQRSFKSAGHEALDQLLRHMDGLKSKFSDWTSDTSYMNYKDLLVNNSVIFNRYYNIFESYQTFRAMIPMIRTVEAQYILAPVGEELLSAIKNDQTVDSRKKVKDHLQRCVVAFTISKAVYDGLFVLSGEGMYVRFDVLPYEKINTNVNLKINDFLIHTHKSKIVEGEQYLKQALSIIQENASDFPEYTAPDESTNALKVTQTKGIIGL